MDLVQEDKETDALCKLWCTYEGKILTDTFSGATLAGGQGGGWSIYHVQEDRIVFGAFVVQFLQEDEVTGALCAPFDALYAGGSFVMLFVMHFVL
eukprot:scaffold147311_cov22-Tisochrysis_lutea.AAC.3